MSYVKGNFKKTIFQSHDSGYLIGLFKVKEASEDLEKLVNQTITFTGYVPELNELDQYVFDGKLVQHPKYGEQFEVGQVERILPTETNAMIEILSSDMFKGIGKKTAEKIVNVFHEETFEVILDRSSDLLLVPGVNAKQVQTLHEAMMAYQGSYEVILALTNMGFTTRDSLKIYHFYKEKTLELMQTNLYQFYYDIDEISFKKVDQIALRQGYSKDSQERIGAAMIYIMREITNTFGHTYYLVEEIISYFPRVIGFSVDIALLESIMKNLIEKLWLVIRDQKLYLKEYYDAETLIAKRLRLLAHQETVPIKDFDAILQEVEAKNQITYNAEQKQAIQQALVSQVVIITGGPGTGKTTIVRGIIDVYKHYHQLNDQKLMEQLALLAPTGRASKRMSEASLLQASTIHRFLKWNKDTNRFQINEYYKSESSFVIVDEASMVDTLLLANLLRGLSSHCKIVFVGDADQLPSVGAGNILEDMIESEEIPVISLKNIYRQGKDSNIINFAHQVRTGIIDHSIFEQGTDLQWIESTDAQLLGKLEETVTSIEQDFQVLAPMYKTKIGIDAINHFLQQLLNPKTSYTKELVSGEVIFRENDKVIQLTNMPESNVFNGDIGQIERVITLGKKEIWVDFDGNLVHYTPAALMKLNHAYAISIHKSQGSEFPVVIIPLSMMYQKMLYRKLLYTAITRSKKKLILIGNKQALEFAIHNNLEQQRKTTLKYFLKNGIL